MTLHSSWFSREGAGPGGTLIPVSSGDGDTEVWALSMHFFFTLAVNDRWVGCRLHCKHQSCFPLLSSSSITFSLCFENSHSAGNVRAWSTCELPRSYRIGTLHVTFKLCVFMLEPLKQIMMWKGQKEGHLKTSMLPWRVNNWRLKSSWIVWIVFNCGLCR